MRLIKKAGELLYPSNIYCIGCGAIIDESRLYSLCDGCMETFHFAVDRTCLKCGKILEEGYGHSLCRECTAYERDFDRGFCCMLYGLYEKDMLLKFKYGGKAWYGEKLGQLMYDRFAMENEEIDLVVPVPIHRKKLKKRGYNQAELLAAPVAKNLGKPLAGALVRTVNTKPMSGLTRTERLDNLENVFTVSEYYRKMIEGKRILLIDDIFTSGSTADACARALKAGGARSVILLVLAAGGNGQMRNQDKN